MIKNPDFLKLLDSKGLLTQDEGEKLNLRFKGDTFSVLMHLADGKVKTSVQKSELGKLWADSLGFSFLDLGKTLFQPSVVVKIPADFAGTNKIIPIYQLGEAVTIATSDPNNKKILTKVEEVAGLPISPLFAFPDDIDNAIEIQYRTSESILETSSKISLSFYTDKKEISLNELKGLAGDQAIVELVRGMLLLSIKERASDIHIEPAKDKIRVRFRIDGILQSRLELGKSIHLPLISCLKLMANLDITEKRRPQDGRLSLTLTNRSLDFRFSSIPTIQGEKIVLRVLGQLSHKNIPRLEELNFSNNNLKIIRDLIHTPNGVVFVTGPTGSGKTTTLYSVLMHLNQPAINIVTVEDPVECSLDGITQVQTNADINLDFSMVLRSFLRQDPDVILIGEIRDLETAKIASQAALTGHLVMTTMHTNNSFQAVTRLVEIGVEPFLVAPSVIGVLAQRLVRKICDHCKEKYPLTKDEIDKIFVWDGKRKVFFYRGRGCENCNQTGYFERIAIHEIFILDDKTREMVARKTSILDIQRYAIKNGFQPLRYDGIKKVLRGLTTIEEVNRATVDATDIIE